MNIFARLEIELANYDNESSTLTTMPKELPQEEEKIALKNQVIQDLLCS